MPSPNNTLRITIGLQLLLIVVYVMIPYAHPLRLPWALQEYVSYTAHYGRAPAGVAKACVTALTVIHLASAVVLLSFRRWARLPYLVGGMAAFLGVLFGGPPVQHAVEYALEESWIFLSGISCGLIYYAPIQWYSTPKA